MQGDTSEDLDSVVPQHQLLDVSASRAKGDLASRGGLAGRHLPSLKKTSSMSSAGSLVSRDSSPGRDEIDLIAEEPDSEPVDCKMDFLDENAIIYPNFLVNDKEGSKVSSFNCHNFFESADKSEISTDSTPNSLESDFDSDLQFDSEIYIPTTNFEEKLKPESSEKLPPISTEDLVLNESATILDNRGHNLDKNEADASSNDNDFADLPNLETSADSWSSITSNFGSGGSTDST